MSRSSLGAIVIIALLLIFLLRLAYSNSGSFHVSPATGDTSQIRALKQRLTVEQYNVTQEAGTETPFFNAYWHNKKEGIYVDVVTGQPLFSSRDKFDSGTGWPSFTRPIEPGVVKENSDPSLGMDRTEIRSIQGDSHLGHVFDDGPAPTGLRYCINSAALRFVPKDQLQKDGYEKFAGQFTPEKEASR